DDSLLAETLSLALSQKGLKISTAHCLQTALELIKEQEFDLAIVDRVLPDGDGLQLVEELTSSAYQTRILVLTTQSEIIEKNKGLKLGADDYLSKPFNHQELMLRVNNLLAKQKIYSPQVITYKNLTLFPEICKLIINDQHSNLRPKETQILACLIYHRGLVVTDKVLIDFVWGDEGKTPIHRSLAVYIRRLRMALGLESERLKTIRGVGYCLS
ncbi:response regulator transcription factor, partial [Patescibacteria group bacterium]|nr:response regulator transcription factor [Patescibacteria group bacterium]